MCEMHRYCQVGILEVQLAHEIPLAQGVLDRMNIFHLLLVFHEGVRAPQVEDESCFPTALWHCEYVVKTSLSVHRTNHLFLH